MEVTLNLGYGEGGMRDQGQQESQVFDFTVAHYAVTVSQTISIHCHATDTQS